MKNTYLSDYYIKYALKIRLFSLPLRAETSETIKCSDMAKNYGFTVNPDKKICDMSVSEKQTVEIIKAIIK